MANQPHKRQLASDADAAVDVAETSAVSKVASRPRKKRRRAGVESATPAETAAVLVEHAGTCLDEIPPDVDRARRFFEAALVIAPDNVPIVEQCATFFSEEGDCERAKELFERCVALQPEQGADKYLYLAQITQGLEALAHYERGAALLQAENIGDSALPVAPARAQQLSGVYGAIAELYMTDLCDEPDAEDKCEDALRRGLEADKSCIEILITKATLRKTQGSLDEARKLGLECAEKIKSDRQRAAGLAEDAEAVVLPSDEAQVSLCRTLIDLGNTAEARDLLVGLLEQDDEDPQVWYLLGCCHLVEKDAPSLQDCIGQGLQLCQRNGDETGMWRDSFSKLKEQATSLGVGEAECEGDGEIDAHDSAGDTKAAAA